MRNMLMLMTFRAGVHMHRSVERVCRRGLERFKRLRGERVAEGLMRHQEAPFECWGWGRSSTPAPDLVGTGPGSCSPDPVPTAARERLGSARP